MEGAQPGTLHSFTMKLLERASTVAVLGLLLAWFVAFRPVGLLNGSASYILVSGTSMEPTLHTDDLVVLQRSGTYQPGDIVAFRIPAGDPAAGSLVIHRIVGGSGSIGFEMRGDNKPANDPWRPTTGDVLGRVAFMAPGAGRFVAWIRTPATFAALAAGVIVFLVLSGGGSPKPRLATDGAPATE